MRDKINLAIGSTMKRLLVVNDLYGAGNRVVIRESILTELNNLNRMFNALVDDLCLNE